MIGKWVLLTDCEERTRPTLVAEENVPVFRVFKSLDSFLDESYILTQVHCRATGKLQSEAFASRNGETIDVDGSAILSS